MVLTEKNPENLRVMQFNLLSSGKHGRRYPWARRLDGVTELFDRLRPDIVGTQEANLDQLQELARALPDYAYVGEGNLGPWRAHDRKSWYCAIFYRKDAVRRVPGAGDTFWLSPRPDEPASRYRLGTRPRLATWTTFVHGGTGRRLVFGTTHLEAINPGHRRRSASLLSAYITRKVKELGPDVPLFLTGDFNAHHASREIRALVDHAAEEPLYDVWRHAASGQGIGDATFRGLGLRDRLSNLLLGPRRIDYVFYRPRLAVQSVQRVDFDAILDARTAPPSDHYPVLAEFALAS